jgi:hypothetical protein
MAESPAAPNDKTRLWTLLLIGLAAASLITFLVKVSRDIDTDQHIMIALQSTNQSWEITPQGVETLRRIDQRALPVLLQWSEGRDPRWYKLINRVRKILKMPPLQNTFWPKKEMARRGFAILRARANPAIPRLLQRLSDTDPSVRRSSVAMLGAIGPPADSEVFRRMTNCLADKDRDVRNDVVWALQFHHPKEYPVQVLLPIYLFGLQDSYSLARQNAMIGLLRMGTNAAPARAQIEKALTDTDPGVRSIAKDLLQKFDETHH